MNVKKVKKSHIEGVVQAPKSLSLDRLLKTNSDQHFIDGPIAIVFGDKPSETQKTVEHLATLGFQNFVILDAVYQETSDLNTINIKLPPEFATVDARGALLTRLSDWLTGRWLYWCQAGESLCFPFCETRSIRDAIQFIEEERRNSCAAMVVDLYPQDIPAYIDGKDSALYFDRLGYFHLGRKDKSGRYPERQPIIKGGLRWRRAELLTEPQQRLDRVPLFRAVPGLTLDEELRFNIEEMNTLACPWHNNLTMAVPSTRFARVICEDTPTLSEIPDFCWHGSEPYRGTSYQLMEAGLMEPGQWF
ncbi:hypothetical protein ACMA5I_14555 [Paracoccaceae bacterium GXU_MW_L88]